MPTIGDIATYLEELAPLSYQEEYDNSGLLVGDARENVQGVMIALDTTLQVLKEAVEKGCNLVISHHPPIFRPIMRLVAGEGSSEVIIFAIRHKLSLYAIHTNLDHVAHGVNRALGARIGLEKMTLLQPLPHLEGTHLPAGAGMLGKLPMPLTQEHFLAHLQKVLSLDCIRYHTGCSPMITTVALCGGAGIGCLPMALEQQADAFITADIKYHQFFDHQGTILLADIGHYESEIATKALLYQELSEKFHNIALFQCVTNTNPVEYYV